MAILNDFRFPRPPIAHFTVIRDEWRYLSMGYTGYMSTQEGRERVELLQGTLDLLILRTLIFGSQHGQGIARAIQETSGKELLD